MSRKLKYSFAILLSACASMVLAQNTNSADVRGTSTDQTGAILPGVKVSVEDITKGVTTTYVTDGAGLYDTGPIVPDNYKVTFTIAGFKTLVRGPLTLAVGTYTVDGQLSVGATAEQVIVTTNVPLLQTESAAQTSALPAQAIADLPLTSTNWMDLIIMMPGANGTPQGGNSAASPDANASVNGSMPYNAVLNDGASILLFYSYNTGGSMKESIAEVDTQASSFTAQYGMGGAVFNQISKGGTSQFHGSLYEYFKNNDMNAASYEFGANKPVAVLKYNWFGGTVGGPIPLGFLKNKAFFFFNMEHIISHGAGSGTLSVPTTGTGTYGGTYNMYAGDFTGQPTIYDPTTQTYVGGVLTRQSFASEYGNGNKIPTALLNANPVSLAIQKLLPAPNTAGTVSNGETAGNYYYSVVSPSRSEDFDGRMDYDITPHNRLTMSEVEINTLSPSAGIGACPLDCYTSAGQNDNAQVTDVWTIRPDLLNEVRMSFTDQFDFDVPTSQNGNFPTSLGFQFAKGNVFPQIAINGVCCMGGNVNGQIGTGDIIPGPDAVYREFTYDPSDVLTLIRGRHVLKFGGEVFVMECDCTVWNNLTSGEFNFNGEYTSSAGTNTSATGLGYADFLLGYSQAWSAYSAPAFHSRLETPQAFAEDTMKLRPNLTIDAGLRWQGTTGIHDQQGDIDVFDPTVMNPANNTLGAIWYATTHANGRTSLQAPVWNTFLPRVGFSYQWRSNTVIRGGFGLFAYGWSHDSNGGGDGAAFASTGSLSDSTQGALPVAQLSSNGSTVYQGTLSANTAFIAPSTNPAAFNGQGQTFNPYHTPISTNEQWSLEVQRELGANMVVNLAYVGSHGYNLQFPTDYNAVPQSQLAPVDAQFRPYPLFQSLGGAVYNAVSNYNALQATINKRLSNGLAFGVNYTWAHFLDSQDSAGWGSRGGNSTYQNAYVTSANYGNSNFDIAGQLKGNVIYTLPFGSGQKFLNNQWADYVVGGWHASAIVLAMGGNPFTPQMSTNSTYDLASGGSQFPNEIGNPNANGHTIASWFNTAAYTTPGPGVFGTVHRNSLRGPGLYDTNMSLGKSFHVWRESSLLIRGDATNIWNHPSWSQPDASIGTGHVGKISGVTEGGRVLQLVAKMQF